MTIEEAYQAMKEGHKVAHSSYNEDEFNYMQSQMEVIYDENRYRWGYKHDTPWNMRVNNENGWFDEGWFICDERELKPRKIFDYQEDYLKELATSAEKVFKVTPSRHRGLKTLVSEEVKKLANNKVNMKIEIPSGYRTALENVRAMSESFNVNKNEYAGNHDGSQGFSAKKNRELNRERRFPWN